MTLKHTPLHDIHAALGAHFTDFGGWDMPLRYGSELDEHHAVRTSAGLFDLSHMGEIWVEGAGAVAFLNSALAGNFAVTAVGRAKYSLMLQEDGGIIDDLIAYRLGDDKFLVVPNAGNAPVVAELLIERSVGFDVTVTDASADTALVAVQGPAAAAILREVIEDVPALEELKYYAAITATVAGIDVLLARTGYTGEDGFELYVPNDQAGALWEALATAGAPHNVLPCGLASRDSLRLEAGMPLYGNELSRDITPLAAGLLPVVSFKKEESFVGREALEQAAAPSRVLVGMKGLGRRAGRAGYPVLSGDTVVGEVTSGQPSPTLGYPIALAYVASEYSEPGTKLDVDLRGKPQPYEVVSLPFYTRG